MNKLEEARAKIDQIDNEIIKLYEKRMEVIKDIIQYKIENSLAVFDSNREEAMLNKNLGKISKEEYKKYYIDVLQGYLKASKNMQEDILKNK